MDISVFFGYGLTETARTCESQPGLDPYAMALCPDTKVRIAKDGELRCAHPA
ncbi:MAG: long-chain fatty acid--CoA ligase [bacterium LCO1.1]|uniref:Long-chain fatty acid--CoA ligase n=1 Tax=Candidatus Weimeria bifida TaxID=2599074 RepID=A0A6N7IY74_9FIRM|nr:long-chain fatty acid--CoA ligase [Candidatus Weimeria bifida]